MFVTRLPHHLHIFCSFSRFFVNLGPRCSQWPIWPKLLSVWNDDITNIAESRWHTVKTQIHQLAVYTTYIPLNHLYIANWMICNRSHLLREPETAIDLMEKKYSWIVFAKTLVLKLRPRRLKRNESSWWWPDYRLFHDFIASVGQLHIYKFTTYIYQNNQANV